MIFLPIFKILARAINLLDTYLLVFTKIFINLTLILQQKASASAVVWSHAVAKGARLTKMLRKYWQKAKSNSIREPTSPT